MRDHKRGLPRWVPPAALHYLTHTETGRPIRAIARDVNCHASTILRQIRKLEARRDDQLVNAALVRLGPRLRAGLSADVNRNERKPCSMVMSLSSKDAAAMATEHALLDEEIHRTLRRLTEPKSCLAVAADMENAVVVREDADGRTVRTAILSRSAAEAMALNEWITCITEGRIARYQITPSGRNELARRIERANAATAHGASLMLGTNDLSEREVGREAPTRRERVRANLAESPLAALARRREKDGTLFLTPEQVAAGERFREDVELSQTGTGAVTDWDGFLAGESASPEKGEPQGPAAGAQSRVRLALKDLGPGLGDVTLRCCGHLEGLEATEKRMGWSARSGKIVLRIALDRLRRHYDETEDGWSPLIG
ncbi:MAG: DUF6456 domain-containing protein [Pseudomonadota bacterium]